MLSLQNSINQVSHSKLVEYNQIKMDLNEFFQQLLANLNVMMEQYSNRFHEIPSKLNIEENLLKIFDQMNFKQKVNSDENLSKKIENDFHELKEDFTNRLQNLFTEIREPSESYQRLQALITTNLETLWLKFENFGSKNSDLLIEKISNLNIQSQFLIQNAEKNAELMKMLGELVTQNSMKTNEMKNSLFGMLNEYFQSENKISINCYQEMLGQLGTMNNHLECLTQYEKQIVVEVLHSTSEEMKKASELLEIQHLNKHFQSIIFQLKMC
jgi:hypothetical protein